MRQLVLGGLLALAVLAGAAVGTHGLVGVVASRTASAPVVGDGSALVTLSGFGGDIVPLTFNGGYVQAGQLWNRAGQGAQVAIQVDPNILVACRGGKCNQDASWTLRLCWSPDTAPQGTSNCNPPRQLLTFSGNGPGNPPPATTGTIALPAGGTGYLFVRVSTNNGQRFCARATMGWNGTYGAGAGAFSVYHSNIAPRTQTYQVGGATC